MSVEELQDAISTREKVTIMYTRNPEDPLAKIRHVFIRKHVKTFQNISEGSEEQTDEDQTRRNRELQGPAKEPLASC
jgi:hypothetical protein